VGVSFSEHSIVLKLSIRQILTTIFLHCTSCIFNKTKR